MKVSRILVSMILILIPYSGFCQAQIPTEQEVQNLTAFAKTYGYVKYFHPSDEARQINWDQFAILGADKVLKANNDKELIEVLESLFQPIAPTIQIKQSKPDSNNFYQEYLRLIKRNTTGLKKVAWQHQGVNMSFTRQSQNSPYLSNRTNRRDKAIDKNFYLFQNFNAEEYRNQTVRLNSMIINKTEDQNGFAELVISIDDENNSLITREIYLIPTDMSDDWKMHELETVVPNNAATITAGIKLRGKGKIWIDDVSLLAQDLVNMRSLMTNGSFDNEYFGRPVGWRSTLIGNYDFKIDQVHSFSGKNSLYIADIEPQLPDQLFDQIPKIGEVAIKEVADNIWIKVPLLLYSDDYSTLPVADVNMLMVLQNQLEQIDLDRSSASEKAVRLANIIIAWNELQHFFPYFDLIDADWNRQLTESLTSAFQDRSAEEFYYTLSKLVASLEDGHGRVMFTPMDSKVGFPFIVDWIENKVVVTHSEHENIEPGDIIQTVDRVSAAEIVASKQQLTSGSHHYTLFLALRQFAFGNNGTVAEIVIDRDGDTRTVNVTRTGSVNYTRMEKGDRVMIGPIDDGIFYVDLDIVPINDIMSRIDEISTSKAVIFDMRGYPAGNHEVIRHLLTSADTSRSWMNIPQLIYPDQNNLVGYQKHGWHLTPAKPRIQGNVVFITDARAISYAESYMGFIEHYQLAEIVGQPTAGANGNVNSISLPGSYQVNWTGMNVLKHDGTQLYKIGILPTVSVYKTIESIKQGRDEFLEQAIKIAREN